MKLKKTLIITLTFCIAINIIISSVFLYKMLFTNEQSKAYPPMTAFNNNCKLIVNGKEVSNNYYVSINTDLQYAEIPLFVTLELLDARVSCIKNNSYLVEYEEKSLVINADLYDFGLAITPGGPDAVRKKIGNELIIDSASNGILTKMMNATIFIDYESSVIYISN